MGKTRVKRVELIEYCKEASQFSSNQILERELERYEVNGVNFMRMSKCKSGWISPRGVFYPCEWGRHELLREFLQRLFKTKGKDGTEKTKIFESTWVKIQDKNQSGYDDLRPHCQATEAFTPRQKLFLSGWYQQHYSKVLPQKGIIVINWKFCIDSDYNIRLKKEDEDERPASSIRRISVG